MYGSRGPVCVGYTVLLARQCPLYSLVTVLMKEKAIVLGPYARIILHGRMGYSTSSCTHTRIPTPQRSL